LPSSSADAFWTKDWSAARACDQVLLDSFDSTTLKTSSTTAPHVLFVFQRIGVRHHGPHHPVFGLDPENEP